MNSVTNIKDGLRLAETRRKKDNLECALRAKEDLIAKVSQERDRWQECYGQVLVQRNELRAEVEVLKSELSDCQDTVDQMEQFAALSRQSE